MNQGPAGRRLTALALSGALLCALPVAAAGGATAVGLPTAGTAPTAAPAGTAASAGSGGLEITSPGPGTLTGTTDLAVDAPAGTTAVRFAVDDIELTELTDLYARSTRTEPVWRTATDVSWLGPGAHVLRVEADTPQGTIRATRPIRTVRWAPPQGTTPLDGGWSFSRATDLAAGALEGDRPAAVQPSTGTGAWPTVMVPSSYGAVRAEWNDYDGALVAYRRTVNLPVAQAGERTTLIFESCYFRCRYFVNGTEVGHSEGGYLPSRVDVTDAIRPGTNVIAAIVDNRLATMGAFQRLHYFYWNYGGLLQQVRLERTAPAAVTEMRAEGAADGTLTVRLTGVNGTTTAQQITGTLEVDDPTGSPVSEPRRTTVTIPAGGGAPQPVDLRIDNPQLWDLEHPRLYTVHFRPDTQGVDLSEKTGFRDVAVRGGDLILNGRVVEGLAGFNRHPEYPGLGRTQPDGLADREIKSLHDRGYRLFRPAHYATTPAELAAADKYGLLVMEEINVTGMSGATLATKEVRDFAADRMRAMVARDRSHPSLFSYSVGNENLTSEPGAPEYVRDLIALGRSLDPQRLYTQVTNQGTKDKTLAVQDFIAVNNYAGWYSGEADSVAGFLDSVQKFAGGKPIMLSEYGAEGVFRRAGFDKGTEWYQAHVVDEHNRVLAGRPHFIGAMYWTSTEFLVRPDWAGGNPDPIPPFHAKALQSLDRRDKLGARVMFAPVRLASSVLEAPPGERVTIPVRVRIRDVRHTASDGVATITPPPGFTVSPAQVSYRVGADAATEARFELTGTLPVGTETVTGLSHAVTDASTEAMPQKLEIRRADVTASPASDAFDGPALDPDWSVVRPDPTGLSLTDRPGSLRLSTLPGGQSGVTNNGRNLLVRSTSPAGDFTATASVDGTALTTTGQHVGLLAYAGDDDFLELRLAAGPAGRVIELVRESKGKASVVSTPYTGDTTRLRLVRRGTSLSAEYSSDGALWDQVAVTTMPENLKIGVQAAAGDGGGAAVAAYIDSLAVRVAGFVTATRITAPVFFGGQPGQITIRVSNDTARPARVTASVQLPAGWQVGTVEKDLAPFEGTDVVVPVTAPLIPTQAVATASLSSDAGPVIGAPFLGVIATPAAAATAQALDSGCATNPVLPGYTRLAPEDAYTVERGNGWVGAPPDCRDRGTPDALRRDFTIGTQPTILKVTVPAGQHAAYVLVGDASGSTGDTVISEAGTVLSGPGGSVPTGQFQWRAFAIDGGASGRVADLSVGLVGTGSWRVNALVVMK